MFWLWCHMCLWKECVCCRYWVQSIKSANGMVLMYFCLLLFSIPDRSGLKSIAMIVGLSMPSFSPDNFCFLYVKALSLDVHVFCGVISYWRINPFVINQSSFLLLIVSLVQKSTLSDLNLPTLSSVWLAFAWYLLFFLLVSIYIFSHIEGASCKGAYISSFFLF